MSLSLLSGGHITNPPEPRCAHLKRDLCPAPGAQWAVAGTACHPVASVTEGVAPGAGPPGPPLLRTTEPLTSLRSSQSAPPAPSASLKQPGFLEFPGTAPWARDLWLAMLKSYSRLPGKPRRQRLGRGSEGSSGLATWPSIRVLFSDVPVSSPRSSGRAAEGIRASGGCEVTAGTYHHVDALFGELHAMLWFNGTVVHPKPSEDAGIHRLWSRVLMWQIPAQGFLDAVL